MQVSIHVVLQFLCLPHMHPRCAFHLHFRSFNNNCSAAASYHLYLVLNYREFSKWDQQIIRIPSQQSSRTGNNKEPSYLFSKVSQSTVKADGNICKCAQQKTGYECTIRLRLTFINCVLLQCIFNLVPGSFNTIDFHKCECVFDRLVTISSLLSVGVSRGKKEKEKKRKNKSDDCSSRKSRVVCRINCSLACM